MSRRKFPEWSMLLRPTIKLAQLFDRPERPISKIGVGLFWVWVIVAIFGAYYQLNKIRCVDVFNMKFQNDPVSEFKRNLEEMRRKQEEYEKLTHEFRPRNAKFCVKEVFEDSQNKESSKKEEKTVQKEQKKKESGEVKSKKLRRK
uniref:Uncharacterized protein n=1 Tax=Romanomermis culicivorax TaxID=13658 RepID=A0A915I7T2_ROMCU